MRPLGGRRAIQCSGVDANAETTDTAPGTFRRSASPGTLSTKRSTSSCGTVAFRARRKGASNLYRRSRASGATSLRQAADPLHLHCEIRDGDRLPCVFRQDRQRQEGLALEVARRTRRDVDAAIDDPAFRQVDRQHRPGGRLRRRSLAICRAEAAAAAGSTAGSGPVGRARLSAASAALFRSPPGDASGSAARSSSRVLNPASTSRRKNARLTPRARILATPTASSRTPMSQPVGQPLDRGRRSSDQPHASAIAATRRRSSHTPRRSGGAARPDVVARLELLRRQLGDPVDQQEQRLLDCLGGLVFGSVRLAARPAKIGPGRDAGRRGAGQELRAVVGAGSVRPWPG